eukprot:gnl/MRDRNA2_/MRDRNA2_64412_c0_seq1.p1 gnl/MRDRNA2_/MRDRNA2_64412_c0~~gnl/MRDRNA2_/MRDRNA2_64412_c0_seq1.p1  ORF type:complete len:201 (-),score=34.94 gnl/MRDRNA2_/MRDRNA2_64412_c0_seq1:164-742(-)
MTTAERGLFYKLIREATRYQEFGSGGSTVVALTHSNIKQVYTVESDVEWISNLKKRKDVSDAIENGRMQFMHGDIGPTGWWGMPVNESKRYKFPEYSGYASATKSWHFDFVFVDGRFRVACMLKALQQVPVDERSKVVFAMHDYMDRKWYHVVEGFLDRVQNADSLAVFRAKTLIKESALQAVIAQYEYDTA